MAHYPIAQIDYILGQLAQMVTTRINMLKYIKYIMVDNISITFWFTKGNNIPRVNTAVTGPPMTPNMVNAFWSTCPKYLVKNDKIILTAPYATTKIFMM